MVGRETFPINRHWMGLKDFLKIWLFDLQARGDTKTQQQNNFRHLQKYCTAFKTRLSLSDWSKSRCINCKLQSWYNKVHLNMISNGDLSDPLCHSVNWSLQTLVRLGLLVTVNWRCLNFYRLEQPDKFSQTTNLTSVLFCWGPQFYVCWCSIKRKCIEMTTLMMPCCHRYFSVECLFNRKIDD